MSRITMADVVNSIVGEQLWVPASEFTTLSGSPTYGQVGATSTRRVPSWSFADSLDQSIGVVLDLSTGWSDVDVFAVWVNVNAGSGDVTWRFDYGNLFELQSIDAETIGSLVNVPAQTQWQLTVTQLASDVAFNPSGLNRLEIYRIGSDGPDDLSGNAALLGVFLRKTPIPSNWLRE